jgi:hypothetical protein
MTKTINEHINVINDSQKMVEELWLTVNANNSNVDCYNMAEYCDRWKEAYNLDLLCLGRARWSIKINSPIVGMKAQSRKGVKNLI